MDEQPAVDAPVPESPPEVPTPVEEATADPAVAEAPQTEPEALDEGAPVSVKYRGTFPGKDQVTGARWECGEERQVPYSIAARLVESRFFTSPAFPESFAPGR